MSKDRFTASRYHRMTAIEKRAQSMLNVRERPVICTVCDMQMMPVDLLAHQAERCTGPCDPGPSAKWITHRDVMGMGIPRATLSFWANNGLVRFVGGRQDRKYLY